MRGGVAAPMRSGGGGKGPRETGARGADWRPIARAFLDKGRARAPSDLLLTICSCVCRLIVRTSTGRPREGGPRTWRAPLSELSLLHHLGPRSRRERAARGWGSRNQIENFFSLCVVNLHRARGGARGARLGRPRGPATPRQKSPQIWLDFSHSLPARPPAHYSDNIDPRGAPGKGYVGLQPSGAGLEVRGPVIPKRGRRGCLSAALDKRASSPSRSRPCHCSRHVPMRAAGGTSRRKTRKDRRNRAGKGDLGARGGQGGWAGVLTDGHGDRVPVQRLPDLLDRQQRLEALHRLLPLLHPAILLPEGPQDPPQGVTHSRSSLGVAGRESLTAVPEGDSAGAAPVPQRRGRAPGAWGTRVRGAGAAPPDGRRSLGCGGRASRAHGSRPGEWPASWVMGLAGRAAGVSWPRPAVGWAGGGRRVGRRRVPEGGGAAAGPEPDARSCARPRGERPGRRALVGLFPPCTPPAPAVHPPYGGKNVHARCSLGRPREGPHCGPRQGRPPRGGGAHEGAAVQGLRGVPG